MLRLPVTGLGIVVEQVRRQVVDALEEELDVDGTCVVDYVRLRFKAVKPQEG